MCLRSGTLLGVFPCDVWRRTWVYRVSVYSEQFRTMNTSIQDRTYEFQQAVTTFSRQSQIKSGNQATNTSIDKPSSSNNGSEFNRQAGRIAKDIVKVTGALTKLAQIAKKKQLYGDKPTDIVELTYIIKQDIFKIEKELKGLKVLQSKSGGSSKDTQINMYNKNVFQLLNNKTKNISENFKEVLQARQKTEMMQRNRQEQLLSNVKNSISSNINGNMDENIIPYAVRNANNNDIITKNNKSLVSDNPFLASLDNDGPDSSINGGFNELSLPDQSQQLLLLEEQNNQYIQERSNAVEAIESTINEVGGLFQQLATMVQEQGEVIQRIDENVEDVAININGAQRELMKYYNSASSNRWLMLKIFGVLIVFFLLWVLIS